MNSEMITLRYRQVRVQKMAKQKSEKWWIFRHSASPLNLIILQKRYCFVQSGGFKKPNIFRPLRSNYGGACAWHCCSWITIKSYHPHFVCLGFTYLYSIYKLMSHNYNVRQNSLVSDENSTSETFELIITLESKLLSRFDKLDKEMLNLKDFIIKDLQVENQRLRNKINNLKKSNPTGKSINSLDWSLPSNWKIKKLFKNDNHAIFFFYLFNVGKKNTQLKVYRRNSFSIKRNR